MDTFYYHRGRLASLTILLLIVGLFFAYLWLDPAFLAGTRRWRLLGTGFGHYFLIPLFAASCLGGAFLGGSTAFGDGKALEFRRGVLVVTTLCGRKRIPFKAIEGFGIERTENNAHLVLEGEGIGILGGSTLRLSLGLVRIDEAAIPDLLEAIARHRAAPAAPAAPLPTGAVAEAAAPALQRPAFGRKRA